jgi:hypothetical protein
VIHCPHTSARNPLTPDRCSQCLGARVHRIPIADAADENEVENLPLVVAARGKGVDIHVIADRSKSTAPLHA